MAIACRRETIIGPVDTFERIRDVWRERVDFRGDPATLQRDGAIAPPTAGVVRRVTVQLDVHRRIEGRASGGPFDHRKYVFEVGPDEAIDDAAIYARLMALPDYTGASEI